MQTSEQLALTLRECSITLPESIALVEQFRLDAVESVLKDIWHLRTEVDCRIEHGAESGKHLDYVRTCLDQIIAAHK